MDDIKNIIEKMKDETKDNINNIINNNITTYEDKIKFYSFLIVLVLNKNLDENHFVKISDVLFNNYLNITNLTTSKKIINLFLNKQITLSYKFLTILFIKSELEIKVNRYIKILNLSKKNKIFQFLSLSNKITNITKEDFLYNYKDTVNFSHFKDIKKYLKSFGKFNSEFNINSLNKHESQRIKVLKVEKERDTVNNINVSTEIKYINKQDKNNNLISLSYGVENVQSMWEENIIFEICKRLKLLVKYFGIYMMSESHVNLIKHSEIETMKYHEIVNYYNMTILQLKSYFKYINIIFKIYIYTFDLYYQIVTTFNKNINITPFDKIIKLNEGEETIDFDNRKIFRKMMAKSDIITESEFDTEQEFTSDIQKDIEDNISYINILKSTFSKVKGNDFF